MENSQSSATDTEPASAPLITFSCSNASGGSTLGLHIPYGESQITVPVTLNVKVAKWLANEGKSKTWAKLATHPEYANVSYTAGEPEGHSSVDTALLPELSQDFEHALNKIDLSGLITEVSKAQTYRDRYASEGCGAVEFTLQDLCGRGVTQLLNRTFQERQSQLPSAATPTDAVDLAQNFLKLHGEGESALTKAERFKAIEESGSNRFTIAFNMFGWEMQRRYTAGVERMVEGKEPEVKFGRRKRASVHILDRASS